MDLFQLLAVFASYFFGTLSKFTALYLLALFVLLLLAGSHSDLLSLGVFTALVAVLVGVGHLLFVGFNPLVFVAVVASGVALAVMVRHHPDGIACIIYMLILMSAPVLFLAMLLLAAFVFTGLGMAIVVAISLAIYLFIIADPLIKVVVVVSAVGTALLARRLRGKKTTQEEKSPLDTELAAQS
jgi:MFS family permease